MAWSSPSRRCRWAGIPRRPRLPPGEIGHTPTMRIAATVALSLAGLIGLVGLVGLATLAALRIALC